MKVNKVTSSTSRTSGVKQKPNASGSSFTDLMYDKKDGETREQLESMMKNIRSKGEELVDSKNLELLVSYKKMVKNFVAQAVNFAFEVVDRKGRSRMGRSKILKIVSKIDENLVEITEEFLSEEKNRLKLLDKIGELGGLLTDIYI